MIIENPLVFSTNSYTYLRDSICKLGNFEKGEIEIKFFPDGERYQRITSEIVNRDIVLIGGTINDIDTLEIYDLSCALVKYGVRSLTLIIPYFGYSTMERATKYGEVVTSKTRARLLSSIPPAFVGNRVFLIDIHSEGIPHYFEGNIRPFHIYANDVVLSGIKELSENNDFVLGCTDAGRAKWVQSLANDLEVNPSFVFKRRLSGEETEVTAVSAMVNEKYVIIYDDMIRTGSSLMNAAKAYLNAGAKKVSAVVTHGVFPQDSFLKLKESSLFEKIVCTNSHPNSLKIKDDLLTVKSVDSLIYKYL